METQLGNPWLIDSIHTDPNVYLDPAWNLMLQNQCNVQYIWLFLFWISHYSIWFPKLHRFQKIKWYYFQILRNKYLTPDTKKYEGSKNNRFNKHSAPRQHLARRGTCEPMGALPWSRFLESEEIMEVDNSHRHRISQDPPPMVSGFQEAVFGRGVLVLKISRPLIGHDT